VNREAVRDIAAGAVDEQRDRPVVVVRQLPKPLDAAASGVLLDVANQVDVAQAVRCFLPQLRAHRIYELGDQTIAQITHKRSYYRIDLELSRFMPARSKTPAP
jgi:hypothetical protein